MCISRYPENTFLALFDNAFCALFEYGWISATSPEDTRMERQCFAVGEEIPLSLVMVSYFTFVAVRAAITFIKFRNAVSSAPCDKSLISRLI